jgi:hypothetical protein
MEDNDEFNLNLRWNIFCEKIWQFQKKAVFLQQQTYPASRKNSALRVSLFL